ncbi:STAS domain-containing protein [Streptomyces sp. NPDC058701]|uniref:STAS domain-containing protein n=1 Tax=Streptomyces sp. NPDC058701 TaxID=3346608 RepID=UPI003657A2D1
MTALVHDDRPGTPAGSALDIGVTPGPQPGTVHLCVSGEIDFDNAALLRETLLIALKSYRGTLCLDLSQVTFCDCAGLNALLTAQLATLRAGRRLRIATASRSVERLLRLTGTRTLLT